MIDEEILLSPQYIKNLEIVQGGVCTLYQDEQKQTVPVVKLYVASIGRKWTNTGILGVLCYVQDRKYKCQFLKIHDINTLELLFQAEIQYNFMEYYQRESDTFFHFEIDKGFIGFSFQDSTQAKKINDLLTKNTKLVNIDEKEYCEKLKIQQEFLGLAKKNIFDKGVSFFKSMFGSDDKKQDGVVESVQINTSIKWDFENDCIQTNNLPKKIKDQLKEANIKKKDLKNPETAKMIFDIVQEHIQQEEKIKNEIKQQELQKQQEQIQAPPKKETPPPPSKALPGPKLPVQLDKKAQNARANLLDEIRKPNIDKLKPPEEIKKAPLNPRDQMLEDIKKKAGVNQLKKPEIQQPVQQIQKPPQEMTLAEKLKQQMIKQRQRQRDNSSGSDLSD